jgi:hypothetical protein
MWPVMAVSGRFAMIRLQEAAQPLDADNLAVVRFVPGLNDPVDALMYPLIIAAFLYSGIMSA